MIIHSEMRTQRKIEESEMRTQLKIEESEMRTAHNINESKKDILRRFENHTNFAKTVHDQNLLTSAAFRVKTISGRVNLRIFRQDEEEKVINKLTQTSETVSHVTATAVYFEYNGTNATGLMMPLHLETEGK
jgi:hypothetical protein